MTSSSHNVFVIDKYIFTCTPDIRVEEYSCSSYYGIIFTSQEGKFDVVHNYHMGDRLIYHYPNGSWHDIPFKPGTFTFLPKGVVAQEIGTFMDEHKNKVELVGIYGSDESHALSAWTSTSRDLNDDKRGRMGKLLTMLATNEHHTPFEKSSQHFLVTTDIASHIHILKHRIGVSVNGESARYKELKDDKFFIPQDWDEDEQVKLIRHCEDSIKQYHECLARLKAKGVSAKRAKESARFYLPYANQITADVMFNFRSFMHFVELRNSEHAQVEIRDIAHDMLVAIEKTEQFPLSLDAFGWTKEKIYGTI